MFCKLFNSPFLFYNILPDLLASIIDRCTLCNTGCKMKACKLPCTMFFNLHRGDFPCTGDIQLTSRFEGSPTRCCCSCCCCCSEMSFPHPFIHKYLRTQIICVLAYLNLSIHSLFIIHQLTIHIVLFQEFFQIFSTMIS